MPPPHLSPSSRPMLLPIQELAITPTLIPESEETRTRSGLVVWPPQYFEQAAIEEVEHLIEKLSAAIRCAH
jgi:hypothetical protein